MFQNDESHTYKDDYRARSDPWTPWKVLEFEMSFQGHLKIFKNENFSLKIDHSPLNLWMLTVYIFHSKKKCKT